MVKFSGYLSLVDGYNCLKKSLTILFDCFFSSNHLLLTCLNSNLDARLNTSNHNHVKAETV